ncbi:VanZ family protein [Erysipelothrix urinaevulpis]|nr:VanZ family protein [Erysipelothrix urinaevulpis]
MTGIIYYFIFFILYLTYMIYKKYDKKRIILNTCTLGYFCAVIDVTIFPIPISKAGLLFYEEIAGIRQLSDIILLKPFQNVFSKQFLLNIMMTIPLGILWYYHGYNFKKSMLFSFLFILSIEFIQLILAYSINLDRYFDINDLIANSIGFVLGYTLIRSVYKLLKKETMYEKQNL